MDKKDIIEGFKLALVLGLVVVSVGLVSVIIVNAPFSEVVYVEVTSTEYPELNQSVSIRLGHEVGNGISWFYGKALPTTIDIRKNDVYYFYVDWYFYVDNGTDTVTFVLESEEYIITRELINNNNGSLLFRLFDDRLRVTFTKQVLNILGGPAGVFH